MREALAAFRRGVRDGDRLRADMEARIRSAPMAVLDYVAVCDPETLTPLGDIPGCAVALLAVRFGPVRLIDNMLLEA